jgi:hypothetical protein
MEMERRIRINRGWGKGRNREWRGLVFNGIRIFICKMKTCWR